jgi:hypothetical protein
MAGNRITLLAEARAWCDVRGRRTYAVTTSRDRRGAEMPVRSRNVQKEGRRKSGGLAVVEIEHPAETLSPLHWMRWVDDGAGLQETVCATLMIAFGVVVSHKVRDVVLKRGLPEEDHSVQTLRFYNTMLATVAMDDLAAVGKSSAPAAKPKADGKKPADADSAKVKAAQSKAEETQKTQDKARGTVDGEFAKL